MHDRLAPGTGIGTTVPFVKMIREKGIKPNAIGVEVISDANLEKGIEYACKTYIREHKEGTGRSLARGTLIRKENPHEIQCDVSADRDRPYDRKNRFVVPPMGNNFANTDGTMSEQSAHIIRKEQKGGFGLITIEATVVHKGAKGGPRKPCLYDDSTIESFRKVIDGCHAEGAKFPSSFRMQGPEGNAKNAGAPIQRRTSIPSVCGRDIPKQLTTEEVYELIKGYGEATQEEPWKQVQMLLRSIWHTAIW